MDYSVEIVFPDPPSKRVLTAKRKTEIVINKKTGKREVRLKQTTHYLTANLWYANIHFSTRSKIVNFAKDYLMLWMPEMPKLEKCTVDFIYYRMDEGFDIDNKIGFWSKVFMDMMKIPNQKEIDKSNKYKNTIRTVNCLLDDNVKYFTGYSGRYEKGEHKLVVKITGRKIVEQQKLF